MPLTYDNWTKVSSKFGHVRSGELAAIDQRVALFDQAPSVQRLRDLATAILQWRNSKGNWTTSIRANAMMDLINLVKAESRMRWPDADLNIFSYVHCEGVVNHFQTAPGVFLQNSMLVVAGAGSGVRQFKLEYRNNDSIFGYDDAMLPLHGPGNPNYHLAIGDRGPVVTMESVAMHSDVLPTSLSAFVETKFHPITQAMVTTGQLSGCCFIMRRNALNNAFECAHIQPLGANWPGGGGPLQNYLQGLGITGNNVTFWGRNDYPVGVSATIVGKRNGNGAWNVYAQRYQSQTTVLLGRDQILTNG